MTKLEAKLSSSKSSQTKSKIHSLKSLGATLSRPKVPKPGTALAPSNVPQEAVLKAINWFLFKLILAVDHFN